MQQVCKIHKSTLLTERIKKTHMVSNCAPSKGVLVGVRVGLHGWKLETGDFFIMRTSKCCASSFSSTASLSSKYSISTEGEVALNS